MGKHWWQNVGDAIVKGVKDTGNEIKRDVKRATGNDRPNPTAYSNMSTNTNSPITNAPPVGGGLPGASPGGSSPLSSYPGAPTGFNEQTLESQFRADPDLAGVLQTIGDGAGALVDFVASFLPKNADGSVDWGKVGSDVMKWVKDNKQTIIEGVAAYENYRRQGKADEYAKQGLDLAKQRFAENEPLRTAGRSGMLNPTANAPDLSSLKNIAGSGSGNPFAGAPIPLRNAAPRMPATAPTAAPAAPPIPLTPQAPRPVPIPNTPPSHAIPLSGLTQAPSVAPLAAPSAGQNAPSPAPNGGMAMLSAQPIPLRQPIQPPKPRPIPLSFAQPPQPY